MRVTAYRLPLPSGGVVRVRKADRALLATHGFLWGTLFPLATRAGERESENAPPQSDRLTTVTRICRVCVLDAQVDVEDLTIVDRFALYQWALEPSVLAPAYRDGFFTLMAMDFAPLVTSDSALLIDAIATRYHVRPSTLLAIDDPVIADDLDMALAYRALSHQADTQSGDVEVEDMFGGKHKMPRAWLASGQGDRVVSMDDFAKAYGPGTYSYGGVEGGDGIIGPQPGADGQRRWN